MKKFAAMFIVFVLGILAMFVSAAILKLGVDSETYIPVTIGIGVIILSSPIWLKLYKE